MSPAMEHQVLLALMPGTAAALHVWRRLPDAPEKLLGRKCNGAKPTIEEAWEGVALTVVRGERVAVKAGQHFKEVVVQAELHYLIGCGLAQIKRRGDRRDRLPVENSVQVLPGALGRRFHRVKLLEFSDENGTAVLLRPV